MIVQGNNMIKVNLTYFKKSGKYYSGGSYQVEHKGLYEIWEDIEKMLLQGKRPGLMDGFDGFHVLIRIPEHEHDHPHLLLNAA